MSIAIGLIILAVCVRFLAYLQSLDTLSMALLWAVLFFPEVVFKRFKYLKEAAKNLISFFKTTINSPLHTLLLCLIIFVFLNGSFREWNGTTTGLFFPSVADVDLSLGHYTLPKFLIEEED